MLLLTDVLSVVGAISMFTHVLAAVALYVCSMYLQTVITALFLAMVVSAVLVYKKTSKLGSAMLQHFSAKWSLISLPGIHDRDHPSRGHAVQRQIIL